MTTRPITLELASAASSVDFRPPLLGVIEDLVALLEGQIPDSSEFPAEPIRIRLQHARDRLRNVEDAADVPVAGRRLVADASQACARLSGHASSREAEFLGVIRLLRELVDGLRGDAMAFRDDLLRSSARVADLTRIEDIRTLRRALNREVDQLRQCVQQGEHREATRFAQVAGDLHRADATVDAIRVPTGPTSPRGLASRATLLTALGGSREPATLVVCRIDEPDVIVDGHGPQVLERVILALGQLLTGTFGSDARVYRSSTECVAMFLPRTPARQVAERVRKVQARVVPEYEYERHGVTRRVVFTFSATVTTTAGKLEGEALEVFGRAEAQAAAMTGVSQLQAGSSGFGRLLGWLASAGS